MNHQTKQENQKSSVSSVNESAENDMQGGISFAPPTLKIYVDPIDNSSPGVDGSNVGQSMATPGNPGTGAGIRTGVVQMNRGRSHRSNADWLDFAGSLQTFIEDMLERHPERFSPIRMRIEALGIPAMFEEISGLISQIAQVEGDVPQSITNRLLEIFSIVHNSEVPERTRSRESPTEAQADALTEAPDGRVGSYPSYFGPVSIDAMERIEAQAESWRWVARFTVIATVISIASASSGGTPRELAGNVAGGLTQGTYDIGNQAQALNAMPSIARRYIIDIATLTYAGRGLNRRETQFWGQLIRNLGGTV